MDKRIEKPVENWDEYSELANWCNDNNYTIIDQGEYYEAIPIPAPTLPELKAAKIAELKAARNAEEKSPLEYGDKLFDYDDDSRDRLAIARQMIEDSGGTGTIEWTMADNTRAAIGLDDFKGVTAAAAVRSNTLHIKYNELKTQVEAVDDNASDAAEQVAAIV